MTNAELFTAALGLTSPWRVVRTEFNPDRRRLDLHLDFDRGARFTCPECGTGDCEVHDTKLKSWRHMDFFQHQAHLHARVPRVRCPEHGVRLVSVPWARPESGFTLLFEALSMTLVREMPVRAAARIIRCTDTKLWRVLHHYVDLALAGASHAGVTKVGIDETSARRGQDYISLFVDLDRSRVLYATEDRNQATVERFAADLTAHGGDPARVTEVCQDMSPAFIKGVTDHLPQAEITFDRYHLIQQLTKAVDQVRRTESKTRPELQGTRYAWLKRPGNLTVKQRATIDYLTASHRALRTARAYSWRLRFDEYFEQPIDQAEDYLDRWYRGAIRSRLEPIKDFAYMIGEHWDGVLRWHQTKISNGVLEAINSLVQAAKRRARGYRTKRNLIAMTYLIAGKLELGLPT